MIGFLEAAFLRNTFQLTDAEIAEFEARVPDLLNLVRVVLSHQAQLDRVVKGLGPIVQKILAVEGR